MAATLPEFSLGMELENDAGHLSTKLYIGHESTEFRAG
jgi:hypothetical protein